MEAASREKQIDRVSPVEGEGEGEREREENGGNNGAAEKLDI